MSWKPMPMRRVGNLLPTRISTPSQRRVGNELPTLHMITFYK